MCLGRLATDNASDQARRLGLTGLGEGHTDMVGSDGQVS